MNKIENIFKQVMKDEAADIFEVIFTSEEEKKNFIDDAWIKYGDDIMENIISNLDLEDFFNLDEDLQTDYMDDAIYENKENIFELICPLSSNLF